MEKKSVKYMISSFFVLILLLGSFFVVNPNNVAADPDNITWDVTMHFIETDGSYDVAIFGEAPNATDGPPYDDYDTPKPPAPPMPPYIQAWFNDNMALPFNRLLKDYRKYPGSEKVWNLTIQWVPEDYFTSTNITISWNTSAINNSEYDIVNLCSQTETILADMRLESSYTFSCPANTPQQFKIMCFVSPPLEPETVYVDDDFDSLTPGWQYDHFDVIQDGIDAVAEYGTVYVYNGIYYEHVSVGKSITLVGENLDTTIVDAGGSGYGIEVTTDQVNISKFSVQNGSYGIRLSYSDYNTIMGNKVSENFHGIDVSYSSYNTIKENIATNNYRGIDLTYSSNNIIMGNNASNNEYGIRLYSSSHNTVTGNTATSNNVIGIFFSISSYNVVSENMAYSNIGDGIQLWSCDNHTMTGNTVAFSNNQSGITLSGSSSYNTITENIAYSNKMWGIRLTSSNYNTVMGNTVYSNILDGIALSSSSNNMISENMAYSHTNYSGISLSSSSNNIIMGNTASNNTRGIDLLSSSNNNTLIDNAAYSNTFYGIRLASSNNNTIKENTAYSNTNNGIRLVSSNSNLIYNNYFNNINNAYDNGLNTWNITPILGTNIIGGNWLGGNYWTDYAGVDTDGDGLGDTQIPYTSSGGIQNGGDYHPLVYLSGNIPPTADFYFTPENPTTLTIVQFTDTSYDSDGVIQSWFWDFGDGTTSSLQHPTHQYIMAGTYTVSLTVTDDDGASDIVDKTVTVIGCYVLDVNIIGNGDVILDPDQGCYLYDTIVTLTPDAQPGWSFTGWSGPHANELVDNGDDTWSITMNGNKQVTCTFTLDAYTLTVNVVGSGTVLKTPDQLTYNYGDIVNLEAFPAPGWTFAGWSGDISSTSNPVDVVITGDMTVICTFTLDAYTLTVSVVGSGAVVKTPDQLTYHYGDIVLLTPAAQPGWMFDAWIGPDADELIDNGNETWSITMSGDKEVTAHFTFIETPPCQPEITLPTEPIIMYAWEFPSHRPSAYEIELTGILGDYNVTDGKYNGWCVDYGTAIPNGYTHPHTVVLRLSYGPLPAYLMHENWHKVNYLLNHPTEGADAYDVQRAIFYFINFGPWSWDYTGYMTKPVSNETLRMIADANENSSEWCPGCGDIIAVICDPGETHGFQITFIEAVLCLEHPPACEPEISLPIDPVILYAWEFPSHRPSAYEIELTNITGDYNVTDGKYNGWCVDYGTAIPNGYTHPHTVVLRLSYGPLPAYLMHENWHKVNYLLNHPTEGADAYDVQRAIFYFINFGPWSWDYTGYMTKPVSNETLRMIADANENSSEWCPGCGDLIAVICDPGETHGFQITFIEVMLCGEEPVEDEGQGPAGGGAPNGDEEINPVSLPEDVPSEQEEGDEGQLGPAEPLGIQMQEDNLLNPVKEELVNEDQSSTPGFQIIIVIGAIALALFCRRKKILK